MRIAFLFSALNHSGAPKMLAWVANQMAKRGHEVHIVSFFETGNMPFLGENVTHHCLNINRNGSRLTRNTVVMAKTQYQLLRKLRQLKPDGIVSFNISGTYIHLVLNKLFGHADSRDLLCIEKYDSKLITAGSEACIFCSDVCHAGFGNAS